MLALTGAACAGWEGHAAGSARREGGGGAEALGAEASSSLTMAHKLDPLLLMLFQHMHARAASAAAGGAPRLWRACMTIFERVLQLSQRVKFTPYIMFMGARLAGVESARAFAAALVTRACTPVRTPAPIAPRLRAPRCPPCWHAPAVLCAPAAWAPTRPCAVRAMPVDPV